MSASSRSSPFSSSSISSKSSAGEICTLVCVDGFTSNKLRPVESTRNAIFKSLDHYINIVIDPDYFVSLAGLQIRKVCHDYFSPANYTWFVDDGVTYFERA